MTDQRWTIKPGRVPALLWPDDENPDMPFSLTEAGLAEMLPDALDRQVASAFAALRDALARDAQVRELDRMMAAAGATGIDLWRWESGDGWCAESDLCRSVIAEGATPSEALADLARQAKEVLGQ